MKSKLIKTTAVVLASFLGLTAISAPAFADSEYNPCDPSLPKQVLEANGCNGASESGLPDSIKIIIYSVISIAGLVAVIYIVMGGFQYMTSAGDSAKTQKAKQTILYACIGLFVCIFAFIIVNFVINNILK